jgi:C_GCAxxG_C_C family probable redox protein
MWGAIKPYRKEGLNLNEELIQKVKDNAKQNFKQGLNCSESVFKALIDSGLIDVPPEMVCLATGFGGGMGLAGHNCGALIAAVMAMGAAYGRRDPLEGDFEYRVDRLYGNPGLYRFFNQMPNRFKDAVGEINCKDINRDYPEWQDKNRFRNCMRILIEAAGIAAEEILKGQSEDAFKQPFGENVAGKK